MFGPDLVLDPHENFNVLNLSGKEGEEGSVNYCKENALKTICLITVSARTTILQY